MKRKTKNLKEVSQMSKINFISTKKQHPVSNLIIKSDYEKRHNGRSPAEDGELSAKRDYQKLVEQERKQKKEIKRLQKVVSELEEHKRELFNNFCERDDHKEMAKQAVLAMDFLNNRQLTITDWCVMDDRVEVEFEDGNEGFRHWIKVRK